MLEMAVVLVIISLLVGGIILGEGLIQQYEVRKAVGQVDQFRTAVNSFKTQFDGVPGDLRNAEDFWGNGINGTQNGNGNKLIEFVNPEGVYEGYRAWQQLALAGVLEGNYEGTQTNGVAELIKDIPPSALGGGYALEHDIFGLQGQLVLLLGNPAVSTVTMLMDGALKPEIALNVDLRIDDGLPDSGVVRGNEGNNNSAGDCTKLNENNVREYDLTKTTQACILGFQM